ncbi:MAG: serine/threonine-protein kinase [Myxococcota bacterium]|jgi:serine/threonine-protein kinase
MDDRLGRYRLLKLLATGGMGEVFLARQEGPAGFAKVVVIKRILRHLAQDQGFIDLFLNEAKLAGQLQHPNIAQVFGLEHEGNSWFIAMEYVHGKSLRDLLDEAGRRELKVPPRIAVRIASQALQGLHFAHELKDERGKPLGILHRDVTPENLLVAFSGTVKLVDFGIARAMTGAETRVGRPKGKVAYMAPELAVSGASIDRRADVFAMGIVLYEALTLKRPANAPATAEEASRPRAPYEPDPRLPEGLNEVLGKAMAPDPADRYQTAQEMSDALEAWLAAGRLTVPPGDVANFLVELFGRQSADVNEGVVPLEEGVGVTAQMAIPKGATQPIALGGGTAPLSRTSTGQLQRVPSQPLPQSNPRTQLIVALVVGGGTALLVGFITLLAVWPRSDPQPVIPVTEVGPNDRVMPELVLTPPPVDAGPVEAPPPPKPSRVVKKPPPPRPPKKVAPKPGRVTVRVNPWAEVLYGGKSYGITPIPAIEVPSGTATFTLRNNQLRVTRKVSVKVPPGGNVVLKADLFK